MGICRKLSIPFMTLLTYWRAVLYKYVIIKYLFTQYPYWTIYSQDLSLSTLEQNLSWKLQHGLPKLGLRCFLFSWLKSYNPPFLKVSMSKITFCRFLHKSWIWDYIVILKQEDWGSIPHRHSEIFFLCLMLVTMHWITSFSTSLPP